MVNWQVGVGKSYNIDSTIEVAAASDRYDLVVALFPTRQVIDERRWVVSPPPGVNLVNLRARPSPACGDLNREWCEYERQGLGALGRSNLCGRCPHKRTCYWPKQYGTKLQGAEAIFGTHAHLERSPAFLLQLKQWVGARRVLVLFDEVNFIMSSLRRRIRRDDLCRFVETLGQMNGKQDPQWRFKAHLMLNASSEDLRNSGWQMPWIDFQWARAVQERGLQVYGAAFKFLGYDLQQFGSSPLESREKSACGDVSFVALPRVDYDFIVYSGTAKPGLLQYRLRETIGTPFLDYSFEHPETRWYNLTSRLGARSHFRKNSPQILDFFAGLAARRLSEGRKVLLVAKKHFVTECAEGMYQRLTELGIDGVKIVTRDFDKADLSSPLAIPLINYGMIGTNLFEHFHCAYCLTSYYVNEPIVNSVLQDLHASDQEIPIEIITEGFPRRRKARICRDQDRFYDVAQHVQDALEQQEMDPVLQAVGRVRPYTQPREVITFQCTDHPQLAYSREFSNLEQARDFFGIQTRQAQKRIRNQDLIKDAHKQGLTQREAVEQTGLGLRTVQRNWNQENPPKSL